MKNISIKMAEEEAGYPQQWTKEEELFVHWERQKEVMIARDEEWMKYEFYKKEHPFKSFWYEKIDPLINQFSNWLTK